MSNNNYYQNRTIALHLSSAPVDSTTFENARNGSCCWCFFGQQDALLYIPLYWRKFSAIFYFYFVDPPFSNSLVLRTLSSTCGTLVLVLALLLLAFTLAPRHTASPCESSRASLTTNNNWHKPNDGKLFFYVCQKKSTKHDGVALQRAKAEHRTQHLISSCN